MTQTADYTELVKQYVQLQDQRNSLDEAMESIKAELRQLAPGAHQIAGVKVTITPNRRIDTKLVEQRYPIAAHPVLYRAAPDVKALRQHLSPLAVDELMTEVGKPAVKVEA